MKDPASERRRFGYRRRHILLKREGWEVNWKKLYRLYREEGLTAHKQGGRKRAVGTRMPMAIPQGPNQRWSLDFMSEALAVPSAPKHRPCPVLDSLTAGDERFVEIAYGTSADTGAACSLKLVAGGRMDLDQT